MLKANTHAGLEHLTDRGPEPRLPLRTCSSRSSDVTVKQANTYMCRESRAADGEQYESLVEDVGYLPKPARPFSAAMVPRGGLTQSKKINGLSVRGTPECSHTIIRLSAASVQP